MDIFEAFDQLSEEDQKKTLADPRGFIKLEEYCEKLEKDKMKTINIDESVHTKLKEVSAKKRMSITELANKLIIRGLLASLLMIFFVGCSSAYSDECPRGIWPSKRVGDMDQVTICGEGIGQDKQESRDKAYKQIFKEYKRLYKVAPQSLVVSDERCSLYGEKYVCSIYMDFQVCWTGPICETDS